MFYKHQQDIIDAAPKYKLLAWECGTGKTLAALKLADKYSTKCIIICPKSLYENWWREIEKWTNNSDKFVVYTKENLRRDWLLISEEFDGVIFDEAHYFAGYQSKMFKNAVKFLNKIRPNCIYLLTATPYLSTPYNIMCYETLLGRNTNFQSYRRKFFHDIKMGSRMIPVIKKGIEPDIANIVQKIGSVIKKEDCLDLPETVYLREDFQLIRDQLKAIKELEDDPLIVNHIVYWTRRHQICGRDPNNEKIKRILEMAKEYKKFIVVCRYNAELEMLKNIINGNAINARAEILNGSTTNRQELMDKMNASEDGIFLINAAMSEGYNLIGYDMLIFYSNGFSFKDRTQMEGRIHRIGQKNRCVYIDFVVTDDIDEDVLSCLQAKKDFDINIYDRERENISN